MKNRPISIMVVQAMMLAELFILFLLFLVIIFAIYIGGDIVKLITDYFQLTDFAFSLMMKFINKKVIIPAIIVVISLIVIKKRIYKVLIALLIVQLLLALPDFLPSAWIAIQLSILAFNSSARKYFELESSWKGKIEI
ncbi:hypothetical protein NNC19_08440 [Clostridium sp. SHJSY1]|uniref:hypothetical protein n=1 Tax=Clostridium sp. SHJSY1 TaxID=2942483 RepID=UPI002876CDDB|nr:hypothetical protein [Clostridium sp. SHJSY1]MDS0525704.1 hypothetical protein [Clostridium sp. SHJSY1]